MALRDVELAVNDFQLPTDVRAYLREAERRVGQFVHNPHVQVHGFVPSCYESVCRALLAIERMNLAPGRLFCEWGSGFGVVASVAGLLGYDACGIEIDRDLFDAALALAEDFEVPVEFLHGSFVPAGAHDLIESAAIDADGPFMLDIVTDRTYEDLGLDICDFDLIFAYPWPTDAALTQELFDRYAGNGALLMTYAGLDDVRVYRKVANC